MRLKTVWIWVVVLIALAGIGYAQTTYATITGTVTDPSGAVIPNVTISATNLERNAVSTAKSNGNGDYTLPQLVEGTYTLKVEAAGFKDQIVQDIRLVTREVRRVDVRLEVGPTASTIEVSGGGIALIETETARIADVKSAETMKMMPLNARWLWAYFQQVPNMQAGDDGWRFGGSRGDQVTWTIDGTTMNDAFGYAIGPQLNYMESYREVNVSVAGNSAEFPGVGNVEVITASGGNQLHGSVFDTFHTPGLRARNFFSNEVWGGRFHIFGGGAGGPVVIPKLYNGKNKTFFYGSYERSAGSSQVDYLNPGVPLKPWREGDFSGLLPGVVIYDPTTHQPFAGNKIPASRINPVSQKVQDRFYPLPNSGDPNVFETANYRETKNRPWDAPYLGSARVDQHFSEKNFMFGRLTMTGSPIRWFEGNLPTIGRMRGKRMSRSATFSYTHVFAPTFLNEVRWGMSFNDIPRKGPVSGQEELQRLGLVGLAPDLPADAPGLLNIKWQGIGLQNISQDNGSDPAWRNHNEQLYDNVSWFRGRHSLKFGLQLDRVAFAQNEFPRDLFGAATFSSQFTSGGITGQGHPYADFLLGIPTSSSRSFAPLLIEMKRWQFAGYVQDAFRVNQKLTLNLGLRYQQHRPWTENRGRLAMFDLGTGGIVVPDKGLSQVSPLFPSGYVKVTAASQAGLPADSLIHGDWNDFAPRISFAWRLREDTVFRGGYNIAYNLVPYDAMATGSPFLLAEPAYTNPLDNPIVFPRVFPERSGNSVSSVSIPAAINPNLVTPWSQQINFALDHQRWGMGFTLGYIGTGQRQGTYSYNYNSPVPDGRLYIEKPRPFPNYSEILYRTNGAGHQYHGMTAEVRKPTTKGLFFQFAWTWQRDIGDLNRWDTSENPFDRRREIGVARDMPAHRGIGNIRYDLPFGKGQRIGGNAPKLADLLVGGWSVASTYGFHSGNFLTPVWTGPDPTGTYYTESATRPNVTIRPDRIANGNLASGRTISRWFDASAFLAPQNGRFGNSAKGIIQGPPATMLNGGLYKTIAASEKGPRVMMEITFRNILNHPNWSNPAMDISDTGGVGRITAATSQGDDWAERQGRLGLRIEW